MISIIIPIWNSEAFLHECLASIAAQTEKEWECLLIDDGSDDTSPQICRHWCEVDGRFKFYRQVHLGVSAARNKGIRESSGEYLTFVDSDDTIAPSYLEHLISSSPSELIVGGYYKCFPGTDKKSIRFSPNSRLSFKIESPYVASFADLNEKFLLYGPWAKLYLSNLIKNNQILFPENRSLGEDLEFNYQYLSLIETISCITDCDYYYHIWNDRMSLTTGRRPGQYYSDMDQWRIIKSYCEKRDIFKDEMRELLAKRLWEIIHDSLLFKKPSKNLGLAYFKDVLRTPEITLLSEYKNVYSCSPRIKNLILKRSAFLFYLYDRFAR